MNLTRWLAVICFVAAGVFNVCKADSSSLNGLRIAVLGDSMSWIGGDSCQNPVGWTCHFKNKFSPAAIDLYARSGATWTNTSNTRLDTMACHEVLNDDNVIYNQVVRLLETVERDTSKTPDIVLIYAGTNDAWFKKARPGIFDYFPHEIVERITSGETSPAFYTSLKGSILLAYSLLHIALPESEVVFVTPVQGARIPDEDIARVSETIAETGHALAVPVLRADLEVPIRGEQERGKYINTSDGVHTNAEGAALIADYIGNGLIKLKNK